MFQEFFHGGFVRHFHGVIGDEEAIGQIPEGEFDEGLVFPGAEQNADGGLVASGHFMLFVISDVGIELAEIFVGEGLGLQLDEDVALEDAVVEDEVHEEILSTNEDPFLACFEAEAVAHFEKKLLQSFEQGIFQIRFAHGVPRAETEKLEDVRIADDVCRLDGFRPGVSHGGERFLVPGKTTALIVETGDLAAKLADGPVAPNALDLVETPLGFVWEFLQFSEMGKGKAMEEVGVRFGGFGRRRLPFLQRGLVEKGVKRWNARMRDQLGRH